MVRLGRNRIKPINGYKRLRIAIEGQLAQLISRLTQIIPKSGKMHLFTLLCNENSEELTAGALRGRFEKARAKAAQIAREQAQHDLASPYSSFSYRSVPVSRFAG